ncbi:MAG: hypothetical protein AMXMBFR34_28780 [Myxococcaceae bacterium]
MTLEMAFGLVLQRVRRASDLTQEDLGFAAGVHRTYVSILERGEKSPTLSVLARLATALGTTPSVLLQEAEQELGSRQGNA